jgi:hypothetical protein
MRTFAWGIAGCGVVGIALSAGDGPALTGCETHNCDPSSYDYVGGFMQDENTYISNDLNQPWLTYFGPTTIRVWFPASVAGRVPRAPPRVLIGPDQTPNGGVDFEAGDQWLQAVAQLAEFSSLETSDSGAFPIKGPDGGIFQAGGGVGITNDTCAHYYARIEVDFVPLEDAGAPGLAVDSSDDAP